MSRFNLIDEDWIQVIINEKGETDLVSFRELFQNAHNYIDLGGESKAQDFAVMRLILAVCHTVFSRFNAEGEVYEAIELDDRMRQLEDVDEDDLEEYNLDLEDTWGEIWKTGNFPEIIVEYLEEWHDRFYLFDEEYPFYQFTKEFINQYDLKVNRRDSRNITKVYGRYLNRLLTESISTSSYQGEKRGRISHKQALFSPISTKKDSLTHPELTRWLISYQSYTGTADKTEISGEKYTGSSGWLSNLGGIYAKGKNLFQSLMLNLVLVHPEKYTNKQIPFWEKELEKIFEETMSQNNPNNIASLYTWPSRMILIDSEVDMENFYMEVIKFPLFDEANMFLEPMTAWNRVEREKLAFYPIILRDYVFQWRMFGLMPSQLENKQKIKSPILFNWIDNIDTFIGSMELTISNVGIITDGSASNIQVLELSDFLNINSLVLSDLGESGWMNRIYDLISVTKYVVENIYGSFLNNIEKIRFGKIMGDFARREKEELYFIIDEPFRHWLSSIRLEDDMDEKVEEWHITLKKLTSEKAKRLLENANSRDLKGIEEGDKLLNAPIAYNWFNSRLNKKLGRRE